MAKSGYFSALQGDAPPKSLCRSCAVTREGSLWAIGAGRQALRITERSGQEGRRAGFGSTESVEKVTVLENLKRHSTVCTWTIGCV